MVVRTRARGFYIDPERRLRRPRYEVLSVRLEQRLPGRLFARFDLLRKRGRDGFPTPAPPVRTPPSAECT